MFNDDQGSQVTCQTFTSVLEANHIKTSVDGKRRWIANVFIERSWRSLKYEEIYLHANNDVREDRRGIGRYNLERRHASLHRKTPEQSYSPNVTSRPPTRQDPLLSRLNPECTSGPRDYCPTNGVHCYGHLCRHVVTSMASCALLSFRQWIDRVCFRKCPRTPGVQLGGSAIRASNDASRPGCGDERAQAPCRIQAAGELRQRVFACLLRNALAAYFSRLTLPLPLSASRILTFPFAHAYFYRNFGERNDDVVEAFLERARGRVLEMPLGPAVRPVVCDDREAERTGRAVLIGAAECFVLLALLGGREPASRSSFPEAQLEGDSIDLETALEVAEPAVVLVALINRADLACLHGPTEGVDDAKHPLEAVFRDVDFEDPRACVRCAESEAVRVRATQLLPEVLRPGVRPLRQGRWHLDATVGLIRSGTLRLDRLGVGRGVCRPVERAASTCTASSPLSGCGSGGGVTVWPAALRAQYPRGRTGMSCRRQALRRPAPEMPSSWATRATGVTQTRAYSSRRVQRVAGMAPRYADSADEAIGTKLRGPVCIS